MYAYDTMYMVLYIHTFVCSFSRLFFDKFKLEQVYEENMNKSGA